LKVIFPKKNFGGWDGKAPDPHTEKVLGPLFRPCPNKPHTIKPPASPLAVPEMCKTV